MVNKDMPEQSGIISSSSNITTESFKQQPLVIKMNFEKQRRNPVKISKALRAAAYNIKGLKLELQKVTRENERLRKKNYRLLKKPTTPITKTNINESPDKNKTPCGTPRSKTKVELKKAGISPAKVPKKIKKKLEMANAMIEDIREATRLNKGQKSHSVLANIVSGKIIKKYKCIGTLSKAT
ncbi:hypothetical protein DPMN_083770 [Dreissena polymorpha]|uniref:Uncharacterized protein n=1 Tax=Dreissena polymorpha TaxID=45954 RepID=A0A9D3Y9X1_DREPO|nr:hypothetical protein DPMN_083770 [Dreissena polymorpha]